MLKLVPGKASLRELERVWRDECPVRIDRSAREQVDSSHELVKAAAVSDEAHYGVNTGFGKLANIRIDRSDLDALQRNLVLSHCCGVGRKLDRREIRLIMALKLLSLGRGASGVSWKLMQLIEAMLEFGVTPVIPSQGSVGASGDLAPLAHLAATMIGEGDAEFEGEIMPSAKALALAGLQPAILGPKEGLALLNGTQFSTALALAGIFQAWQNVRGSIVSCAFSTDAAMGSTAPLVAGIHELRGHRGQIDVANQTRSLLKGSEIRESHRTGDPRVQDPYCIRCNPQVTGAAVDLLRFAAKTLEIEANAATDNPLVLLEESRIISGGNFHAEPVAFAADQTAIAISEIGAIAQRRVALLVDPSLSFDLPPFLAEDPGLNSGMMVAEIATAALMSENKHLANPCSTDSTPTSASQEDHVAMAAHAAKRLEPMNRNLNAILGVELMCAAQGVEFRKNLRTSAALANVLAEFRKRIKPLGDDRILAADMECASELVRHGCIANWAGLKFGLQD